jgi:hypothetical protein
MEYIIYNPNGKKMTFRYIIFTFHGFEVIDDESVYLFLSGQVIKFYWSDTTINDRSFTNMIEFTEFLQSLL